MPTDARLFTGRMNDDDSVAVIPSTDYRYAKNVHIIHSVDGSVARIKNLPGTEEVEFALEGTAGTQVVGSYEDEERNRVFYFVKATTGNDEILCFFRDNNTVMRVFSDGDMTTLDGQLPTLNLSASYLVTGIGYVYPWLFWTDNNSMPRRIDTERALRTNNPTYTSADGTTPTAYNTPVNYKDIAIVREPPRYPIEVRKLTSADESAVPDQTTNQIELYAFQFAYRFLYRDGSYSVLSPYSKTVNFNCDTANDTYDTIEVKIPKRQSIPFEVSEFEILVRTPGQNDWAVIKRYNRTENAAAIAAHNGASFLPAIQFYFYNNYTGTAIPEADGLKASDSVPLKSKSLEIAQNRLFLGNNLEGYDPIRSLELSATRVYVNAGTAEGTITYIFVYPNTEVCNPDQYAVLIVRIEGIGAPTDGYYYVQDLFTIADWNDGTLPTVLNLSPYDKIGELGDFDPGDTGLIELYAQAWGCMPPNGPGPGIDAFIDNAYTGTQPTVYGLGNTAPVNEGDSLFKSGSRYRVGIVFYDFAHRNAGVYTNDNCLVSIPEKIYTGTDFTTGIAWQIDGVDNNTLIPTWATHYAIVRTKNLTTSFFIQGFVKAESYVHIDPDDGTYVYEDTYPTTSEVFAIAWDIHWFYRNGYGYTFAEGDVLKFFPNTGDPVQYYGVIGQEGRYLFTVPKDIGSLAMQPSGLGEIYTPTKDTEQPLFYEVGEIYQISNAGTANRAFSVFSGVLRGDIVYKYRETDNPSTPTATEAMSPHDSLWKVWNTDVGRVNIELIDAKQQRRDTALRWSNQYVAGSKINGICAFNAVDEKILDERLGAIQKLSLVGKAQSEGSVMLIVGTTNTMSAYLGETQVVDNSAQTLLATSGNIVGTVRELQGGYGTNHPESFAENGGRAYWYDEQRGAVIRYASNGLTPISDYKFRAFFNRIGTKTQSLSVIGGFDKLRGEYIISITGLSVDSDVEYLQDYDGPRIGSGTISTFTEPVGLAHVLVAGITYNFEVSWAQAGTMQTYVGATLVDTTVFVGTNDSHIITITPTVGGALGYLFTPDGHAPRGSYSLNTAQVSEHQAWQGSDFTLGFRDIDGAEGWASFYSFVPEWIESCGNLLLSFVNGAIYRHDNETAYNTFYGTEYPSGISWVVNSPIQAVKWPAAIGFMSNDPPYWVHYRCETPNIQSSDNGEIDFRQREGFWYADILRDRLSPNESGEYAEIAFKGDRLRSSFLEIYAEFRIFTEELAVDTIKVLWKNSAGHF